MKTNWDTPGPSDILDDIETARDMMKERGPVDQYKNMIFPAEMAREIDAIMTEHGFTHMSQVLNFLAAKVIKEDGLERYLEIVAHAYSGLPYSPERSPE